MGYFENLNEAVFCCDWQIGHAVMINLFLNNF